MEAGSSWTPSWAREDDAFAFIPGTGAGGRRGQSRDTWGQRDAHQLGREAEPEEGPPQWRGKHEEAWESTPNLTCSGFTPRFPWHFEHAANPSKALDKGGS